MAPTLLVGTLLVVALLVAYGPHAVAQRGLNGFVSGSYIALGAVGLTLIYGTLRLVNVAHGDMLTLGAYVAFLFGPSLGLPLPLALAGAAALTAALMVGSEVVLWRPMRGKGAGLSQLLLISVGVALLIRNGIQLFAGTEPRSLGVDVTSSVRFVGLGLGRTELIVAVTGLALIVLTAVLLRSTTLGRQIRAVADDFDLAEISGVDTRRIVVAIWILAAGLAGIAGGLYAASIGVMTPNLGAVILLSLFAAATLGGIGNAYGALVGGLVVGLVQEWSTLVIDARWKVAVGFVVLIGVLLVRPQGLFGRGRAL